MAIMMMTAMAMSMVARDGFISGQTGQASNYLSDVPGPQPQTQREALTRGSLAGKGNISGSYGLYLSLSRAALNMPDANSTANEIV